MHEGAKTDKLSRPDKKESKGVVVWKDATEGDSCYIHSSNDRLFVGDGHALDAFDCFRILDHGGNFDRAFEAAKREQGTWTEKGTRLAPIDDKPPTPAPVCDVAPAADDEQETPSPLMRPLPDQMPSLGWIDSYADLMTRLTGSPREFNVLGGLMVVASAIQRRAVLRMAFGDVYTNLFGAYIARSSVYHKSSALGKARQMLKRANLDGLLMAELATSEGLLKELAAQGSGLIVRDEIGTLFGSHNQKYLVTLKPDLTALYDCYPYSRRLSNDAVDVPAPYLNILGATTPTRFFESVSYTDWQDGFLARWLFVTPNSEPDFDAMTGLFTAEHDAAIGALSAVLVNIDRQHETTFMLAGDAHGIWDRWQRQAAREAYYYGNDVEAAIVTRYAAYALKFAMILAAVNGSWGTVSAETMTTAIVLADMFKNNIGRLLAERSDYGISGAKLQKVFAVVKKKGSTEGVTKTVIMQNVRGVRADDATACIEKLLEVGAIVERCTASGKSKRYVAVAEELPIKSWK
ncbi:MAG: DUF3987 domain-containing protein [Caldilineaceae bacterium]